MKGWTTAHKPPRGVTLDRRDGLIQGLSAYWLLHEAAGELINDLTSNSQPGD